MDRRTDRVSSRAMTTTSPTTAPTLDLTSLEASLAHPTWDDVERAIARRSFCLLATTSAAGRPHVAGVLYDEVDGDLYVSVDRPSRKARNVEANRHVSVTVPIRRIPVGPPATAMFQTTATVLCNDDPLVARLAAEGRLGTITGHGELDLPSGCIVRIDRPQVVHTFGLGLSLWRLMRAPLRAGGRVELPSDAAR